MWKFRFDRGVTVGLVHPVLRILSGRRGARLPILMYHGIRDGVGARHSYFETNTSPELFSHHLRFLCDNGYETLHMGEAVERIASGSVVGRRVVITFDDGYRDFHTHAFPRLREHGFKATVFIVSGLTGDERICSENKEFMTWNEIRELHSCGIQIGSHTVNHPELYRLSRTRIEDEIRRSKETIDDKLGSAVSSFSYPFAFPEQDGRFTAMVRGFLEKCGYENGVCTIIGTAGSQHNRYFLPRLPINSHDDLRFFKAKLEGGYDWLHQPQRLYKSVLKRAAPGVREPNRDIHCCE